MIIWSGWGVLTFIFGLAGAVGGVMLIDASGGLGVGLSEETGIALGLLLAAVVNWFAGVRLNDQPGREMIDVATGQRIVLRRRHRLFWVPMQYWSVVLIVLAGLAITTNVQIEPAMGNPRAGGQ